MGRKSSATSRVQEWLGGVRHLRRLSRGSGTSLGGNTTTISRSGEGAGNAVRALDEHGPGCMVPEPGLPSTSTGSFSSSPDHHPDVQRDLQSHHPDVQRDLRSCSYAFQALSVAPSLQPVLLMHPLQEEALRDWLQESAPNTLNDMGQGGTTDHSRDTLSSAQSPASAQSLALQGVSGSGMELVPRMAIGDSRLLPDGSSLPTKILMYNCSTSGQEVTLDLNGLIDRCEKVWMPIRVILSDPPTV